MLNDMFEVPNPDEISFNQYQELAHGTSVLHEVDDPDGLLLKKTLEETLETMFEDTESFMFWYDFIPDVSDEKKQKIAKELGDVLWCLSEYETRKQRLLGAAALEIYNRNADTPIAGDDLPINRFDALSKQKGGGFMVVNHKLPTLPPSSLIGAPGYVLQRILARLNRYVGRGIAIPVMGPPGNADLDDTETIARSPQDSLWVISAASQMKLDTTLAEIATDNLKKVYRRKSRGTILSGEDPDRSS